MTETRVGKRSAAMQLQLHVPVAAAPSLEGAARAAVVRLLARLLTSAAQGLRGTIEVSDETR